MIDILFNLKIYIFFGNSAAEMFYFLSWILIDDLTQLFNKATNKLTEQLPKSKIIADTAVTNKLIIKDKKHRHKK